MRKGGIPDPDCPTDPESTRFWAHTHSKFTDREKVAVSHEAEVAVASTVDSITAMLSSTGEGAGQLALTNGSDSAASAPSGGPSLVFGGCHRPNGNYCYCKGESQSEGQK